MKQVAKIVFWVILTLAGLWLLWAFRSAATRRSRSLEENDHMGLEPIGFQ